MLMIWFYDTSGNDMPGSRYDFDGGTFEGGLNVVDSSENNNYSGCSHGSELIKFSGGGCLTGTGIKGMRKESGIHIFPNPASQFITIEGVKNSPGLNTAVLLNLSGQKIIEHNFSTHSQNTVSIQLPETPSGMYILQIITKTGIQSKKVLIH